MTFLVLLRLYNSVATADIISFIIVSLIDTGTSAFHYFKPGKIKRVDDAGMRDYGIPVGI